MSKARDLANAGTALTTVSATELGYLDGVTSAVQTQVDAKIAKSTVTAKGDLLVATGSGTVVAQPVGTDGQFLQADSTQADGVKWATVTTDVTTSSWLSVNSDTLWGHTTAYSSFVGLGILTDSSGNNYTYGTIDQTGNLKQIYVIKRNATGVTQWERAYSASSSATVGTEVKQGAGAIEAGGGNFYLAGDVWSGTTSGKDHYLLKINSDGDVVWSRKFYNYSTTHERWEAVTVDGSNNVIVGGTSYDGTGYIGLFAKFNSAGTITWQVRTNLYDKLPKALTTDSSGNIYASLEATFTNTSIVIMKITSAGAISWQKYYEQGSTGKTDRVHALDVNSAGTALYAMGYTMAAGATQNPLVMKISTTDGSLTWARYTNSYGSSYWYGGFVDKSTEDVYAVGVGNISNNGARTTDFNKNVIQVIKYNSSGTRQWIKILSAGAYFNNANGYGIKQVGSYLYISGYITASSFANFLTARIKTAGTDSNTNIQSANLLGFRLVDAPSAWNDASATLTATNSSFTLTTSTWADVSLTSYGVPVSTYNTPTYF